ncbi:hypothetical protein [Ochrobactrum sp. Marseille-Q0166]|uniref:tetratricopeptide repeat protein n=1 Tax=Ochrobactrum sp. Marseille-Q0166 TaxID=2761105 RepID=UPI00165511A4|nr:hypothetical protein [Ochrobactrum sp. Marseille-Q0166]MBC8719601.1 hypothetical protein [Ochrobactrum sp. Marseille-Q0166]
MTRQVAAGERFLSAGNYAKGYQILDNIGENNPASAEAALKVADTYFVHHAYLRAKAHYKNAIARGNRTAGELGLGRVMLATNEAVLAEQQFLTILNVRPQSAEALNGLGVALDLQGRHQEAQHQYTKLLESLPTDRNGNNNLAVSYILAGRQGEASNHLGELARSYLDDPVIRQNLAMAQVLTGDRYAAEKTFALDMSRTEAMHNVRTLEQLSRRGVLTAVR